MSPGNRSASQVWMSLLCPLGHWSFSLWSGLCLQQGLLCTLTYQGWTAPQGVKPQPPTSVVEKRCHWTALLATSTPRGLRFSFCYYTCSRDRQKYHECLNLYLARWGDLHLNCWGRPESPAVGHKTNLNKYLTQLLNWNSSSFEEEVGSTT